MTSDVVILSYNNLEVVFDADVYTTLVQVTGWTVKLAVNFYPSVRATKQPYTGTRLSRLILKLTDPNLEHTVHLSRKLE